MAADIATFAVTDMNWTSPAMRGFWGIVHRAAVQQYGQAEPVASEEPQQSNQKVFQLSDEQFAAFAQLGKKTKPIMHLDMQKELDRIGLGELPHDFKPSGEATDKLHTKAEKLAETKATPFVFANLHNFLPPHSRTGTSHEDSDDEHESETMKSMRKVMGVQKQKRSMSFLQCVEGLHRYAIAAAACRQFKLSSGLAHISIVMQVATKAVNDQKRHQVAVFYDQIVREKWASAAYHAGAEGSFNIDDAMTALDDRAYKEALSMCTDVCRFGDGKGDGKGEGKGKGKGLNGRLPFAGVCNYCGKTGHRKSECYKLKAEQRRALGDRVPGDDEAPAKKTRQRYVQHTVHHMGSASIQCDNICARY